MTERTQIYQSMEEYLEAYHKDPDNVIVGVSPGAAALRLGVSRQFIHKLMAAEILRSAKIVEDGEVAYCFIDEDDIDEYRQKREANIAHRSIDPEAKL